jgi:hypothetical protein
MSTAASQATAPIRNTDRFCSSGRRRWTPGRLPGAVPQDWRQEASPSPAGKPGPTGNVLMNWGGKWALGRRDDPLGMDLSS